MEEQLSDALVCVKSILSDVNVSVQSVSDPRKFLPVISDILSELSVVVNCINGNEKCDANIDHNELWWDSSPELVAYSDVDSCSVSTIQFSSDCGSSSMSSISSEKDQAKTFIDNILSFLSVAAPNDVFSRRKSERRRERVMRSLVHPELFTIWQNSSQMFTSYTCATFTPAPLLPTINLRDVNARALGNLPKPYKYPVQGCSQDPDHYTTTCYDYSNHFGPIGWAFGYQTNNGIVAVPDQPVHGYIWDHDCENWTLFSDASPNVPRSRRTVSRNKRG